MEKSKFVPYDKASKKEQRNRDLRKRGFPVPPSQVHKSAKDYDRGDNKQIIDDGMEEWEEYEEEYDR